MTTTHKYLQLHQHLNIALNSNRCPGEGALGECAATYPIGTISFVSEIYLWKAGDRIKAAEVIAWAELSGISRENMLLEQVLHDDGNHTYEGRTTDGCRHLRLTFTDPEGAASC